MLTAFSICLCFILTHLSNAFVTQLGMLGHYNEEKWLGFTLADFEHSCVQEDPTIYSGNSGKAPGGWGFFFVF